MIHRPAPPNGEKPHDGDLLGYALRLTASMAHEENMMALLRQGLELCAQILGSERGLLISEDSSGRRRILARCGSEMLQDAYSTTALQKARETAEPLLISDTVENQDFVAQESICTNEIRSVMCTTVAVGDSASTGAHVYLYFDSRTDRHPFSLADLERFRLLERLMAGLVRKSRVLAEQEAVIQELRTRIDEKRYEDLVYSSDSFKKCITLVSQGAAVDVPVLLLGETGTGKERLARIVHDLSRRKDKPFIAVNCGAIPANLIESQLFGHEKGAFTGAVASRKGFFEEASGGTLFLDEIGELPLQVQTQFLRALQEGEVVRVGSARPVKVDVRIVAATNVDLERAVTEGRFRKDLFYRLNVLPVTIPAVRERGEDALLLAHFFLRKFSENFGNKSLSFSRDAEKAILVHGWPGNVREIQNRVQRAVITAAGAMIGRGDLGLEGESAAVHQSLREAREAVDREMIGLAMKRSPGNLTNAAKILDIDRKSLRILLEKYGIAEPN